jgi:hypothetical protein
MKKGNKPVPGAAIPGGKAKVPPQIFVLRTEPPVTYSRAFRDRHFKISITLDQRFARAHFRIRQGALFLCWKDGKKVKAFYLARREENSTSKKLLEPRSPGAEAYGSTQKVLFPAKNPTKENPQ